MPEAEVQTASGISMEGARSPELRGLLPGRWEAGIGLLLLAALSLLVAFLFLGLVALAGFLFLGGFFFLSL